ncbi:hypothetical protein [Thermococcus sp.]
MAGCLIGLLGEKLIEKAPFMYNNENVLYKQNEIRYYKIPPEHHITGFVESKGKFSVYILTWDNLSDLKAGKNFTAILSWVNRTFVRLNLTTPNQIWYIVIKNQERKHQWIRIDFTAKRVDTHR